MKNHLEKKFKQLNKEIRVQDYKKLIEIEFDVLKNTIFLVDDSVNNITSEQFQKSNLKKFKQLVKQEKIEKDFNNAINIDKRINSKELKKELKENLKSVFNTISSGTSELIEAISFQYNYDPKLSILCWAGGEYEANKIDNFSTNYPNCTHISSDLIIEESVPGNITNLNGLSQIEYLSKGLIIRNNIALSGTSGLDNIYHIGHELRIQDNEGLVHCAKNNYTYIC